LRDEVAADIRSLGAELVVIGNGSPEQAADFRAERKLDFPLYVDTKMQAYAAAGLKRGVAASLNLRSMGHAVRALRKGHLQGRTQGDPWQQGGAFVIVPPGRVVFEHVSQEAGDHADPKAMLEALRSALGS
jgi:hypothetical protein